jgi:formylglycine-generating enzyme required for sulfatase activity
MMSDEYFDRLSADSAENLSEAGTLPGFAAEDGGRVDRYVLQRKLGAGGFGAVYLAEDTEAGIQVAMKTLPGQIASSPDELERMRGNFALVQKLHHPNIAALQHLHKVEVVDAAASQALQVLAGDYLLVMEYAQGSTLSAWRALFPGRKVPVEQALQICRQIAAALDYAHAEKIVHRDIKPANVMVNGSGEDLRIKVLDFGLAAEIRSSLSRVSKEIGDTSGTRPYMSPEQWSGRRQGAAADQYSLAVLFYELVSGAVPFASAFETNDPIVMLNAGTNLIPETLPELSKHQNAVLLRALAKDPSERFASCRDFITALEGRRRSGSGALRLTAALLLLLALAIGGTYAWRQYQSHQATVAEKVRLAAIAANAAVDAAEHFSAAETAATSASTAFTAGDFAAAEKSWSSVAAKSQQPRIPAGFRAAPGTRPETYTNTGWAAAIIHEATGIELVYIPAGRFTMGSPKSEQDAMVAAGLKREWVEDEVQHQVTISQGFYLGKYEVTQGQWQKLMGNNPSYFQNAGLDAPVESVSWDDCQEFCRKAGSGLRLPTEAEWEYACRAGTTTALYSGDIKVLGTNNAPALDPIAWYGGNCGVTYEGGCDSSGWAEKQYDHSRAGTHPVGRKKPNAWGLYDMIGNVWEWCQDWAGTYPTGAVTDPKGPGSGEYRMLRGGSWNYYARSCRCACRVWIRPGDRYGSNGLRVACSAPPVQ